MVPPYGRASDPRVHPRVCPLRELRVPNRAETIALITDFNWELHYACFSPDGQHVVVEGISGSAGKTRTVNAYDSRGKSVWVTASNLAVNRPAWIHFDPTSSVFTLVLAEGPRVNLLEMPSRAIVAVFEQNPYCLGPGGIRWMGPPDSSEQPPGISLFERGYDKRLVRILLSGSPIGIHAEFSLDGRHVAWGNPDGTVTLCDLVELQRRLAEVGLGW
jgi:hypothetical protein